ncbi:MAG TPA: hypothetical protein VLL49_00335 [Anaerolineales bacterium]|nr:hypothetical protein [Anaerolineales bacterium]
MPFDFSSLNLGLLGWLLIGVALLVLVVAVLRLFGHLVHLLIRGCGVVLLALLVLYILRLLGVI